MIFLSVFYARDNARDSGCCGGGSGGGGSGGGGSSGVSCKSSHGIRF